MKKLMFIAACSVMLVGCVSKPTMSASTPVSTEVTNLRSQVDDLAKRLAALEDKENAREAMRTRALSNRVARAAYQTRVRSKSKLVIQPKTYESMNILGEKFPLHSWQIRKKNLEGLNFKKPKPKMVKPLVPDSKANPPAPIKKEGDAQ